MAWDTGMAAVIAVDDGVSFWQPSPTGGHIDIKVAPPQSPSNLYSAGTQTIPPGGVVPVFSSSRTETMMHVASGAGVAELDAERHILGEGSTIYVGRGVPLGILNDGTSDLVLFFVTWPPAHPSPAEANGRPRRVGDDPPPPFESPAGAGETSLEEHEKGPCVFLGPDDGDSYWQPAPTDGYVTIKLSPANLPCNHVTVVEQLVPPGKLLPAHGHPKNEELKFVRTGTGIATVQGVEYEIGPGDLCVTGRWVEHSFLNTGDDDLVIVAVFMPPALEVLLAGIGRPRTVGDDPPPSFGLPDNVAQLAVEGSLVVPREIAAHTGGAQ